MRTLVLTLSLFGIVGCGAQDAIDATKKMPTQMEDMSNTTNSNMAKTNAGVHKQTLAEALKAMKLPENTEILDPPTKMIMWGKGFAEEATAAELADFARITILHFTNAFPKDPDSLMGNDGLPNAEGVKVDTSKRVDLMALMVIAGLTPQNVVEQMINDEIYNPGPREDYVYQFLALRAQFIKHYQLDLVSFASGLSNPGKFEEALDFAEKVEFLVRLPFASKISIATDGLLDPSKNFKFCLKCDDGTINIFGDTKNPSVVWKRLKYGLENDLAPAFKISSSGGPMPTTDRAYLARLQAIRARVLNGYNVWVGNAH